MDSGTSFSSLPISLQLRLLDQLDWTESLPARLVCADWYELINYLKPPKFSVTDRQEPDECDPEQRDPGAGIVLPCLINSYYEKIATLAIDGLMTPLPITSSNRMLIPQAEKLVLGEGNSEQNVLKLLRCYARTVNKLCLDFLCLPHIKPCLLSHTLWNKMTQFEIYFDILPIRNDQRLQDEMKISMHMKTLSVLLASLRIPHLTHFKLHIWTYENRNPELGDMPLVHPLKNLSAALENFLAIHGPRLVNLTMQVPCTDILNCCKHTNERLKILKVTYEVNLHPDVQFDAMYGLRADPRLALGCFKNLVHLTLCPKPLLPGEYLLAHENTHHEATALILANNKRTLREFTYRSGGYINHNFRTFSWLIPDLKLKRLEVGSFDFGDGSAYERERHDSPKLENVTEFSLGLGYGQDENLNPRNTNWTTPAFNWIVKTMPALQTLIVRPHSQVAIGLAVCRLIEILTSLTQIEFEFEEAPADFNGVTEEVMDWIGSTRGQVTWSEKITEYDEYYYTTTYKLRIQRP